MHRDVLAGRKFELASLTEFVVNEGLKYEMELPTYKIVLDKLTQVYKIWLMLFIVDTTNVNYSKKNLSQ